MRPLTDIFSWPFIMKFLKFAAVGLSGVVIDFGTTYLCKEIIKIPKYVANAIGFTVAASSNYLFNRIWTFQSHNPQIAVEYFKFIFISLIGLGINTLILWILVSRYKKHFYLSKLFAIAVVTCWNFIMNLIFTFTR
jgi:putative flippase GtrA